MEGNVLAQVLVLAVLVEALVNTLKPLWDKGKGWNIDVLVALGLGVVITPLTGVDLFKMVGLPLIIPYVGSVLTGVILSRGSNMVHELWKALDNFRQSLAR